MPRFGVDAYLEFESESPEIAEEVINRLFSNATWGFMPESHIKRETLLPVEEKENDCIFS